MKLIRDTFVAAQEEITSHNNSKVFLDTGDYLKAMLDLYEDFVLTDVSFFLHNLILKRAKVFRYLKGCYFVAIQGWAIFWDGSLACHHKFVHKSTMVKTLKVSE